jgi:inhibitor of cysteine peptidase
MHGQPAHGAAGWLMSFNWSGLMRRIILTVTFLVLSGAVCVGPINTGQPAGFDTGPREATLVKFNSVEEMRTYFADQALALRNRSDYSNANYTGPINLLGGLGGCAMLPSTPSLTGAPSSSDYLLDNGGATDSAGDPFSTTNIQEAGVDESDVVKNDGTYLYLLRNSTIRIIQAVPAAELKEVASITLQRPASELYLRGDQLVAIAGGYSYGSGTVVKVYNIADRTTPVEQATITLAASEVSSRLIGGKLHLVLSSGAYVSYSEPEDTVRGHNLEYWTPAYSVAAASGNAASGQLASWDSSYHPTDNQGYGLTTVATIDLDNPSAPPQSTSIAADAGVIYASPSALYVTDSQNDWWIEQHSDTMVHKFSLTAGKAEYVGTGLIPGHILNQYSLGEKDGFLRVGVTTGTLTQGGGTANNAVYVLGESATAGKLDTVGRVENIAPGEKIYSARFVGDRGFLVTFKKVDPLYTLDMSDPAAPRVVGQLKVPGYSDYIHPLDANHLLTIGKDAVDEDTFAWYQGIQLSIFDVTDFANPALLAKEVIGVRGTESEADTNPKAFNYFAPMSSLAIPIALAEGPTQQPYDTGHYTFNGLYVYRATVADGFQLLGRISTGEVNPYYYYSWYGYESAPYTRGVFIGDTVYAVSNKLVTAAPAATPGTPTATLTLP